MASFLGHLYVGAAVSAAAVLGIDSLDWNQPDQILAFFVLGVIGGLLPDIDSDKSTPARVLFTLLGVALAFLVSSSLAAGFSLTWLALIWGAVFLLVRFGLFELFAHFTVHRGIWHSWLALAFTALATADAALHLAGLPASESWLAGLFVALGYLAHLCLDEISGIDLRGIRVKRSFGTALKPFSMASPSASAAMFLGVILLAYLAPTLQPVIMAANELLARTNLSVVTEPKRFQNENPFTNFSKNLGLLFLIKKRSQGKGDIMWSALSELSSELRAYNSQPLSQIDLPPPAHLKMGAQSGRAVLSAVSPTSRRNIANPGVRYNCRKTGDKVATQPLTYPMLRNTDNETLYRI